MSPMFIAFEGGEGAGKSTQCDRLAERLDAVRTREPGGTLLGRRVRELFLDPATGAVDPRAEAMLMAADRAQHVAELVRPSLAAGRHVVTDRYLYSSVAYQAHARGLDPHEVRELSLWATGGLEPDLVVFLDLDVPRARSRMTQAAFDRMESEDVAFHERVRAGFHAQAERDPARWVVVDAAPTADQVELAVWAAATERLPALGGS